MPIWGCGALRGDASRDPGVPPLKRMIQEQGFRNLTPWRSNGARGTVADSHRQGRRWRRRRRRNRCSDLHNFRNDPEITACPHAMLVLIGTPTTVDGTLLGRCTSNPWPPTSPNPLTFNPNLAHQLPAAKRMRDKKACNAC